MGTVIFVDVAKLHTTDIIIIFGIIFSVRMLLGLLILLLYTVYTVIFIDVAKLHTTDIIIIFGIIFSVGMLLGLLIILYVKREASNM